VTSRAINLIQGAGIRVAHETREADMSEFHDASLPHVDDAGEPVATLAKDSRLADVLNAADEAFEYVSKSAEPPIQKAK
jgi:hypothetical protein